MSFVGSGNYHPTGEEVVENPSTFLLVSRLNVHIKKICAPRVME